MTALVPMVTVTAGLKAAADGSPGGNGTVEFHIPSGVVDSVGNLLEPQVTVATVTNGAFTAAVSLPATDTSTSSPATWMYKVNVRTDVWAADFHAPVPASPTTTTLGLLWKASPDNPAN